MSIMNIKMLIIFLLLTCGVSLRALNASYNNSSSDSPITYDVVERHRDRHFRTSVSYVDETKREKSMGVEVNITDYPYVAVIGHNVDPALSCGRCVGTVITPLHVITAAHCFVKVIYDNATRIEASILEDYYVRVGSALCNSGGTTIGMKEVHLDSEYYDIHFGIALITLQESPKVRIVTLAPAIHYKHQATDREKGLQQFIDHEKTCQLLGWPDLPPGRKGGSKIGVKKDIHLKAVDIKLLSWKHCLAWNSSTYNIKLDGGKLTCGEVLSENKVPCPFAMGTPLLCDMAQHAITVQALGCHSIEEPVILALISLEINWISDLIQSLRMLKISSSYLVNSVPLLTVTSALLSIITV